MSVIATATRSSPSSEIQGATVLKLPFEKAIRQTEKKAVLMYLITLTGKSEKILRKAASDAQKSGAHSLRDDLFKCYTERNSLSKQMARFHSMTSLINSFLIATTYNIPSKEAALEALNKKRITLETQETKTAELGSTISKIATLSEEIFAARRTDPATLSDEAPIRAISSTKGECADKMGEVNKKIKHLENELRGILSQFKQSTGLHQLNDLDFDSFITMINKFSE